MFTPIASRSLTASLVAIVAVSSACGEASPTAPYLPTSPAPTITAISPDVGSTGGDTSVTITGTGFESGAIVTAGGVAMTVNYGNGCSRDCTGLTKLYGRSRPRGAGTVDVVVINPDRQTGTLSGGYTYAPPESFDPNGIWEGGAITGHEHFAFTVRNDLVVSVSCADSGVVALSPPAPVSQGTFSFAGEDGTAFSGKIVSPAEAIGTVSLGFCSDADWYASKT